ncbi:MAG: putative TonB protein [Nitrospira sp.]|nr:MAG: putative TonB protein [Nitrospira sp.]
MLYAPVFKHGEGPEREGRVSGWVCSCVFHGLAIIGALYGLRIPLSHPEPPFRWEVALREAVSAPIEPPRELHEAAEAAPVSAARAVVNRQPVHRAQAIARLAAQPYEQAVPMRESIARTIESQAVVSERERPAVVQGSEAVARASAQTRTAYERTVVPASSIASRGQAAEVSTSVTARPTVERPPAMAATAPEPMEVMDPPLVAARYAPVEERPVLHTEASHAMPGARAHYGWLKEALAGKIERMKRYPDGAAERRWEGRVVVRGVITAAGELRDLVIAESSGFQALDEDAVALLRRISPLALAHPLGQAQVAWRIPITYGVK